MIDANYITGVEGNENDGKMRNENEMKARRTPCMYAAFLYSE